MSHKVLVLCQRRSSEIDDLSLINENINELASQILGDNIEIKYLTDDVEGTSDFVGKFGNNDWTRETFRGQKYSLIICNTCPLPLIDYEMINEYLENEGFLALSAFHIDGSKMPVKKILNLFLLKTIKSEGFEPKGVIGEGAILFQKKSVGGGKINTKPKGSRKNKRTRRNKRTRKSRKINLHFK